MARTKALLGAGARLSDYLSASLVGSGVYPADQINEILDEQGPQQSPGAQLPALAGVDHCMAQSLHLGGHEEVFSVVSKVGLGAVTSPPSHRGKVVDQRVAQQDWCRPIHPDVTRLRAARSHRRNIRTRSLRVCDPLPSTAVISRCRTRLDERCAIWLSR